MDTKGRCLWTSKGGVYGHPRAVDNPEVVMSIDIPRVAVSIDIQLEVAIDISAGDRVAIVIAWWR